MDCPLRLDCNVVTNQKVKGYFFLNLKPLVALPYESEVKTLLTYYKKGQPGAVQIKTYRELQYYLYLSNTDIFFHSVLYKACLKHNSAFEE